MFAPLTAEEHKTAKNSSKPPRTKTPLIPVPLGASPISYRHPKHGEPGGKWAYQQADGAIVAYAVRFDFETNGKPDKEVLPITFCEVKHGARATERGARVAFPRRGRSIGCHSSSHRRVSPRSSLKVRRRRTAPWNSSPTMKPRQRWAGQRHRTFQTSRHWRGGPSSSGRTMTMLAVNMLAL